MTFMDCGLKKVESTLPWYASSQVSAFIGQMVFDNEIV